MMRDTVRSAPDSTLGPLPLVIGVTGRHDLREQDRDELRAQVMSIFEHIQRKYRHTPLVLLSALAEGADRLVARVALDIGARLVPVLPMSREEYKQTFPATDDESRGVLHGNNTLQPIVIPSATNDRANAADPTMLQRLPAGVFIARRCQILIAVGDGQHDAETDKAGQIVPMVRFKLEGELALSPEQRRWLQHIPEPYGMHHSPLDPLETGPVYYVPTPGEGQSARHEPQRWQLLAPKNVYPGKEHDYFRRGGSRRRGAST